MIMQTTLFQVIGRLSGDRITHEDFAGLSNHVKSAEFMQDNLSHLTSRVLRGFTGLNGNMYKAAKIVPQDCRSAAGSCGRVS